MARRARASGNKAAGAAGSAGGAGGRKDAKLLIVGGGRADRECLIARLDGRASCTHADSVAAARRALAAADFDLALISCDLPDGSAMDLARELADANGGVASILLADRPSLQQAVDAMRSGAADLLAAGTGTAELLTRIRAAILRTRALRQRDARIDRLKKVCRKLNSARQEVTRQIGSLCNDMVEAYQELADQVTQMALAAEFASLIRQDLDVESLLRTALEFLLSKTGPTNAAVFLPSSAGDFSLGAYVNYDCPRDTADMVLDHLANVVPPRIESEPDIRVLATHDEVCAMFGDGAQWLTDMTVATFACRHDGECLAVVLLFRDRRTPFDDGVTPMLRTISGLFGRQLGRVVHIHHRHLPKDQWGGLGEADDDIDLAA